MRDWARTNGLFFQSLEEASLQYRDLQKRLWRLGYRFSAPSARWPGGRVPSAAETSEPALQRGTYPFGRTMDDVLLLEVLLCGAYMPNFLLSRPRQVYVPAVIGHRDRVLMDAGKRTHSCGRQSWGS